MYWAAYTVTIYAYYISPSQAWSGIVGFRARILGGGGPVFGLPGFEPLSICLLHNLYAVLN